MPSCVKELTKGGNLQAKVMNSDETNNIHTTQCNDSLAFCSKVKSKLFKNNSEAKYGSNGVLKSGCPGGDDCYLCEFTTNDGQQCFEAMQPNALLSQATKNPDTVLPIIPRDSESVCSDPSSTQVSCMADVVTDSQGNPLSTLAVPNGFGPDHLHKAYNLPCTPNGEVDGACDPPQSFGPQIVAIVDAFHSPTIEQDLSVYSETYGLPPCTIANGCLTIVNQNGTTSPMPSVNSTWALEAALDVQMAHAICQTCKILLVEANSNYLTDLGTAVNRAALMGATVISNSYGARESGILGNYDTYYDHPGVGVTAATGDWGFGAYYPASSNKVIAVGGTALSIYSDFSYANETVWNGTGSGCSSKQNALSIQTALPNWNQTGCDTKRSIGDVSAVASPSTGVAVYNTTPYNGRSGWWILGGTSVSSPIYAAVLALDGGVPTSTDGVTIPYQNKDKFRDVTVGSNGSCGGTIACQASAGYDGPTGLGSPNLLSPSNEPPSTTPLPTASPSITPISSPSATITPSPTPTPTPSSNSLLVPISDLSYTLNNGTYGLKWSWPYYATGISRYRVVSPDQNVDISYPISPPLITQYNVPVVHFAAGYSLQQPYTFNIYLYDASNNESPKSNTVYFKTADDPGKGVISGKLTDNGVGVVGQVTIYAQSNFTSVVGGSPSRADGSYRTRVIPIGNYFVKAVSGTKVYTTTVSINRTGEEVNLDIDFNLSNLPTLTPTPLKSPTPTPTMTPTSPPINCTQGWSSNLGSTSLSGNAGDTVSQSITITNNNSSSCGSALFTISYGYPSGWTINNLPASVTLVGGETKTIPFTITINPQAQAGDYTTQFWILSGSQPMNGTIHVLNSGPTTTPTPTTPGITCNNLPSDLPSQTGQVKAYLYKDEAVFNICNAPMSGYFQIDISYDPSFPSPAFNNFSIPDWTRWDRGSCCQTVTGIAFAQNNSWGTPFQNFGPLATGIMIRPNNGGYGFIPANQVWANWQCGKTLYWRLSEMYNPANVISPTYSATISCTIPQRLYYADWSNYFNGTNQVQYDSRWDANGNGVMDKYDYQILVSRDLVTVYR